MTRNERAGGRPSRRTFLRIIAASGLFAGASKRVGAQEQTFELGGSMGGWQATAPSAIEGETNPTLELEPGETYVVEWTNRDGFEHNFVILDRDGNEVLRTDTIDQAGQTQIVRFTASEEMTQYICEIHPETMRGDISIAGREDEPSPYDQGAVVPTGESIGLETVADGLTAPLDFETAPGLEDRQFVVDQPGRIYVLEDDGLREEPFLDISDQIVDLGVQENLGYDERGLLGLAFHPDFQENQRFFVRYSAPRREGTPEDYDHTDVLAEFEATEDMENGDPDSERTIWEIPSPQMNHNSGQIAFGPDDGYLYSPIGDGGDADDTGLGHVQDWYEVNDGGNAQNTTENLLGGIHRLDVDSEPTKHPRADDDAPDSPDDGGYAIPEDNPLVDQEDHFGEYYAWGLRNPRTLSFDSDGRLFVGDAGQNRFESVYLVEKGGNYGWNVLEGTHCFSTDRPSAAPEDVTGCPDSTPDDVRGGGELLDPIIEFPHRFRTSATTDGSTVIGGHVYEGDAIEPLQGTYVLGNWSGRGLVEPDGEIFVATEPDAGDDAGLWSLEELVVAGSDDGQLNRYVYAFGRDQDGELYVLTNVEFRPEGSTGEVYKLVPAGEGKRLSEPAYGERADDEIGDGEDDG